MTPAALAASAELRDELAFGEWADALRPELTASAFDVRLLSLLRLAWEAGAAWQRLCVA